MASFDNLRLLAFLLSLLLFGVLSSAVQNQMFRVVAIDRSSGKDITNTGISKQNQLTTRSMDNFTSHIIPKHQNCAQNIRLNINRRFIVTFFILYLNSWQIKCKFELVNSVNLR